MITESHNALCTCECCMVLLIYSIKESRKQHSYHWYSPPPRPPPPAAAPTLCGHITNSKRVSSLSHTAGNCIRTIRALVVHIVCILIIVVKICPFIFPSATVYSFHSIASDKKKVIEIVLVACDGIIPNCFPDWWSGCHSIGTEELVVYVYKRKIYV